MRYLGMNQQSGERISDAAHIRQSVRDILITPVGTRLARREYGSLVFDLLDQPQNAATRLQVMSAIYTALNRWEPRLRLTSVQLQSAFDGSMAADVTAELVSGQPVNLSVSLGNT
ncbi:GPW/gp25 family protein [Pectobacteriaceae bacterium CE90]|uniref:GPW/gp25 family protein n=1 Tax=Brenneria uluponensis TaxID=3057057 RepID=UPI0025B41A55|nr:MULTISPECIES: GPW/gp25 family protein [Pectobacteriaceae]WJV57306.1 GPW/gp25 family protein [Pectobacteriaceae bacterium C111]WJY14484.1 GPW/gp25 family protein [Pectobacteriaceae bacterium CE90]WJV52951.1 GPW/gp25 family protein [Prodigiosinella sp. LS101]WJV54478.1 GPW/gp25 family protein [Prodigiosinella sp. LS101]WJV58840.1 GPW/gp25 family protein [Pectobacteriaceae bacterium C111]